MNTRTLFVVAALSAATYAAAAPKWAPGEIKKVRVLDAEFAVVCVITERNELDALGSWLRAARTVKRPPEQRWTHKLDIDAPRGGRWLYDALTGEFQALAMKSTRVYRLAPADKARLDALLVSAATAHSPSPGDRPTPP